MNYLEIIGTLIGLVYLWLEYKASVYLWIVGVIMPAIYIFVYYRAGLYADFGINIYYLIAAIYGWMVWTQQKSRVLQKKHDLSEKAHGELPISTCPRKVWLPLSLVFVVTFVGIGWILINFTDSNVPWLDSFTTALSIVGMWMLVQKYLEQWLAWIAVDVVSCGLYTYKDLFFTSVLYGLYALIAVLGYMKWKKMIQKT